MALAKEARANGKLSSGAVKDQELYKRWVVMRRRCYDRAFIVYGYYGGRGVKVCEEWRKTYLPFQTWALVHGWRSGLTLDRIDSNGDYTPDNCRWITQAEQSCNRPEWTKRVTIDGVTDLAGHWADRNGIPRSLAYARISKLGWKLRDAVTIPSSHNRRSTVMVGGIETTVYALAKSLGVRRSSIYQKLKQGKPIDTIVSEIKERRKHV